jgi:hypothetical protein
MGWLDNLWRRRQGRATDDKEKMVNADEEEPRESETEIADELAEEADEYRDEQIRREGPIPPGTG